MDDQHTLDEKEDAAGRAIPATARSAPRPQHSRFAMSLQAWARRTFAPASLLGGMKSLAWVAPLSVLIWIYAEREQVATNIPLTFSVQVRSLDPSRIARLADPADGKLRGDFSGPQGGMEQLREGLESGTPVHIELGDGELTPGPHPILSTRINQDPLLVKNGISVSNCSPRELAIFVDTLEEVTLDVQPPPDAKNIVGAPTFEPRKVKVVGPHTALANARLHGKLVAVADLESIHQSLDPGTHDLPAVSVSVPISDPSVSVVPSNVVAHYEVKRSDATYTIPAIPVWVIYPPGMEDKYKAQYEPFLANVTLIGPEEQIRAMRDPSFEPKPKAMFEVKPDDVAGDGSHERRLRFDLPFPQLVHVSPDDEKRTVSFKLVERHTSE